ncbi:MAG: DUF1800 family protein [Gammaproteobacteria bacterium]|nr:DUF1800 family protein [Gammaproteobacteria bacterium]
MRDGRPSELAGAIAVRRFGLGARPGELAAAAGDPRDWLLSQVRTPYSPPVDIGGLESGAAILATYQSLVRARRVSRARSEGASSLKNGGDGVRAQIMPFHISQVAARTRIALTTAQPFRERLVHFWTNHFAVSVDKPVCLGLAGALENEAIRPNVTGRFLDLLLAVETHPAMIMYLDNARSIGPDSLASKRTVRRLRGGGSLASTKILRVRSSSFIRSAATAATASRT